MWLLSTNNEEKKTFERENNGKKSTCVFLFFEKSVACSLYKTRGSSRGANRQGKKTVEEAPGVGGGAGGERLWVFVCLFSNLSLSLFTATTSHHRFFLVLILLSQPSSSISLHFLPSVFSLSLSLPHSLHLSPAPPTEGKKKGPPASFLPSSNSERHTADLAEVGDEVAADGVGQVVLEVLPGALSRQDRLGAVAEDGEHREPAVLELLLCVERGKKVLFFWLEKERKRSSFVWRKAKKRKEKKTPKKHSKTLKKKLSPPWSSTPSCRPRSCPG